MTTQYVKWLPVITKNVRGQDCKTEMPDFINEYYGGALLNSILEMPRRNAMPFDRAITLILGKCHEAFDAGDSELFQWYRRNFVEYISNAGFHIELTGDEFEVHNPSRKNC